MFIFLLINRLKDSSYSLFKNTKIRIKNSIRSID